jgi:Domain of Unknown Function (DUF1080)
LWKISIDAREHHVSLKMKQFCSLVLLASVSLAFGGETVALFNGKDLSGWTADVPSNDGNAASAPVFIVREGKLVSLGKPGGHLLTKDSFSDYKLVVEYRFAHEAGNCGVLIHASTLRALNQMFPQSIEVQMMHQQAGDFWCIHENIQVPDMEKRRPKSNPEQAFGGMKSDARRIINLTDGSEKPLGEWNTMEIECKGDEVIVHVNGALVNHGSKCTAKAGKIALQAEGVEVEFRKVELTHLK